LQDYTNRFADKAKLRAIGGRKATGPPGIAGSPKQPADRQEFCSTRGAYAARVFYFQPYKDKVSQGEEIMRILLIGMMAATFVLGMGFISFIFLFGKIVSQKA
jgi:hypothetical protein